MTPRDADENVLERTSMLVPPRLAKDDEPLTSNLANGIVPDHWEACTTANLSLTIQGPARGFGWLLNVATLAYHFSQGFEWKVWVIS